MAGCRVCRPSGSLLFQDEMAPLLLANKFHPSNVNENYLKKNAKTKINKKPKNGKAVPTGGKKHYLCI